MTRNTACESRREAIAALVLGELDGPAAGELREHLGRCETCRGLHDTLSEEEGIIESAFEAVARSIGPLERKIRPRTSVVAVLRSHKVASAAAAAAIIAVIGLAAYLLTPPSKEVYALEQTVEAVKNVRYMHIIRRHEDGTLTDERWFEIGPDGYQTRYRQDSPPHLLIVDDGKTCFVHHKDKNTVILYDRNKQQYQWIGNLGEFFRKMAGQGTPGSVTIEENVGYKGRAAHRVRWHELNTDVYIDPKSKLPIAMRGYDISYEEPREGTFKIVLPEGVPVVDKRPGAEPVVEPEWMEQRETAGDLFTVARYALAVGDYTHAIELFQKVVAAQPRRNWAWFWLGEAHFKKGDHDAAIEAYSRVIDLFAGLVKAPGPPYCHYARGMAYLRKGDMEGARKDFGKTLPTMIKALREVKEGLLFDYADDPTYRDRLREKRELPERVSRGKMIARLRRATGKQFGYHFLSSAPYNETAIRAWENWWREHAHEYGVELEDR